MKTYEIEKNVVATLPIEKFKVLRPEKSVKMPPYYQGNKIVTINNILSTMSVAQYPKEYENKTIISHDEISGCWQNPKRLLKAFSDIKEFKYDAFVVDKDFRAKYNATIKEIKEYKKENTYSEPSIWVGGQPFLSKVNKGVYYGCDSDTEPIETIMKLSTLPQTKTTIYVGQQVFKEVPKKYDGGEYNYRMTCFDIVEITDKEGKTILVGIFCPTLENENEKQFKVDIQPIESGISVNWKSKIKALDKK